MRYTIEKDELLDLWFIFDTENEEALPNYYDDFFTANIKYQYLNELNEVSQ